MLVDGEIFSYAARVGGGAAPAPPPFFAAGFTCPFASAQCTAVTFPRCPCVAVECAWGKGGSSASLSFEDMQPECMRVALRYCRSAIGAGQGACAKFRSRKQEVKVVGAKGGIIEDDVPEVGGHKVKVTIPAGAISADTEFGVGELEEAEVAASIPMGRTARSSIVAITPYGMELSKPIRIDMPHVKAANPSGHIMVWTLDDLQGKQWKVLNHVTGIGRVLLVFNSVRCHKVLHLNIALYATPVSCDARSFKL